MLSTLLCDRECWAISSQTRHRLEASVMWFHRHMLRISWTDHKSNEKVLRMAGAKEKLLKTILENRQLEFWGHLLRKEGLASLILKGQTEDRRVRRKQCITYLKSLVN